MRVYSSISVDMYTVSIRHSSHAGLFHCPFIQAVIMSLTARLDMRENGGLHGSDQYKKCYNSLKCNPIT